MRDRFGGPFVFLGGVLVIPRTMSLFSLLLAASCAGSRQEVGRPSPEISTTVYMRVFGNGKAPRIDEPVVYYLCVDLGSGKLVDVLDAQTRQSVDDTLPNVLRGWHWSVASSIPIKQGARCWRERFEPAATGDALPWRASIAEPARMIRVDDGAIGAVGDLREETDREVAFIDRFEGDGTRYLLLIPRLTPQARVGDDDGRLRDTPRDLLPTPRMPRAAWDRARSDLVRAMYSICFDSDGHQSRLVAEVPIDGAAESMGDTLRRWRTVRRDRPSCILVSFDFHLDRRFSVGR